MLGIYEKRHFGSGERIWFGRYKNLTNVLHWHFECEIIRIVEGNAQIKIGDFCFEAAKGDCFFCAGEELHYIISEPEAQVDIMIFDESIVKDITDKYAVISPKLPDSIPIKEGFDRIKKELSQKELFYREALVNHTRGLTLDIFRNCCIAKHDDRSHFYKKLISKINDEFSFITFEDAVRYSGYSSSHFSKMFKKLSGMNFSEYLNIIKVENAIILLRNNSNITMTSVSLKCGFSTVRNFNRVFKQITGFSPLSLPKNFIIDTGLKISRTDTFDPTSEDSKLI